MSKTGAEKKPETSHPTPAPKAEAPSKKGHAPVAGGCHAWGCKGSDKRFNFCEEHYEHFKFGLIKKTGEPVPDYEKKFEHFVAFKARQKAHKVA